MSHMCRLPHLTHLLPFTHSLPSLPHLTLAPIPPFATCTNWHLAFLLMPLNPQSFAVLLMRLLQLLHWRLLDAACGGGYWMRHAVAVLDAACGYWMRHAVAAALALEAIGCGL
jgi:hypothetical protein